MHGVGAVVPHGTAGLTCPHLCRSHQIFDIFTYVFGSAARTSRLKYVVGTWGFVCNGGTGCGPQAMNATLSLKLGNATLASKADLVAVTAYFDCGLGADATKDMLVGTPPPANVGALQLRKWLRVLGQSRGPQQGLAHQQAVLRMRGPCMYAAKACMPLPLLLRLMRLFAVV